MSTETDSRPYLQVQGLVKWFGNDRAVDDISFGVARGKFLTLLGPSGCGKTTTLMSIAGLHGIDAGMISQIIGRILRVKHVPFTALEISPTQVDFVRKFGGKLYYGDASRVELLRAAHAEEARVFVIAVDDIEASIKIAETVKTHFPNLTIIARVRNRHHAHRMMDLGIKTFVREVYLSSLKLAEEVLCGLGMSREEVVSSIEKFKTYDDAALIKQHAIHHDETQLIQSVKDAAGELQALFEADAAAQKLPSATQERVEQLD